MLRSRDSTLRFPRKWSVLIVVGLLLSNSPVFSDTIQINQFTPMPVTPVVGEWYLMSIVGGGTASTVSLKGLGGNLENNQPLPIGAALVTTGFSNADKAEVGTFDNYGSASSLLNSLTTGYSYYKEAVVGGNTAAAPSLKLTISAPGVLGHDHYGQLVYEPYWNLGSPPPTDPPTGAWQTVTITPTTGGGGVDSSGGWWWTGGFGIPSGAGGPPIRSLAEWATAFASASDSVDFASARIVGISVGVGSYNQGQIGYFDNVSLSIPDGQSLTYNFEPIPEPTSLLVMGGSLAVAGGFGWLRRRRGNVVLK